MLEHSLSDIVCCEDGGNPGERMLRLQKAHQICVVRAAAKIGYKGIIFPVDLEDALLETCYTAHELLNIVMKSIREL